jgi:hypothetical protein
MAKVAVVATGLAMATSMLSLAPIAHAATFSVNLTIGSTGADVTALQQALIAGGYSIPAGATGYFGTQTRAAVAAWQSAKNIAPAVGYFGPISRAAFDLGGATGGTSSVPGCAAGAAFSSTTGAACTTTSTVPGCAVGAAFSSTTGAACTGGSTGGALTGSGRLTNVSSLGDVTSSLKEGDATTAVIGVSADATGGDVSIQRVDVAFVVANVTSQSVNLDKYVSDVSVWLGNTKLASMDPALGDKSSRTWTLRFSGLNGVIKSGTTGNLYVKVTPLSSIGTNEDGKTVTAELLVDSLRAVAADGISDTYIATQVNQAFTVSATTDGTLTVTAASDNPTASQVAVSSSTTTGVKLLSFNMKAKNQDVTVTDLEVGLQTSDSLSDVINTVYLMKGSTVVKSKTVSTGTGGVVLFTDVNQTIAKDATQNYTVVADLKGDSAYPDGTTLVASTTITNWDVSDANGTSVTPSAAAAGTTQTLTATGISVVAGSITQAILANSGASGVDDVGSYVIPFTVTAGDNDVFISGTAKDTKGGASATADIVFATTTTSGATRTGQPSANLTAAGVVTGDSAGVYYKVLAGTSRVFTLNVTYTGSVATGWTGLQLSSIAYGLTSSLGSTFSSNLDTFKTTDLNLVDR